MLGNTAKCGFGSWYSKQTTPSLTSGVQFTTGSGSKGSYVESAAALAFDVYFIRVWVNTGATAAGIRDILMDIHYDPAGGTSYAATGGITNLFTPQASTCIQSGRWFSFPLFIPAGATVAVRGQGNSAATVRCAIWYFGRPTKPENFPAAQYSETIGVSGNGGTPYVNGTTSAWGSWTSIGTTTRPCWHWTLAFGHNTGTTTALMYFAELAYSSDGTNMITIIPCMPMFNPGTSEASGNPLINGQWEVPAGGTLYVRGSTTGAAAETTEAVAVGLGG